MSKKSNEALVKMLQVLDGEETEDYINDDTKAMVSNLIPERDRKEIEQVKTIFDGINEQLKKENAEAYKRDLEKATAEAVKRARAEVNRKYNISDTDKDYLQLSILIDNDYLI